MSKSSKIVLEAREEAALLYLLSHIDDQTGGASVSMGMLSKALDASHYQVAYTLRSLVDAGQIEVREQRLPNGGRLENEYRITERGMARLLKGLKEKTFPDGAQNDVSAV